MLNVPMIRLSIQGRQALPRLTLPGVILASFALMLLGKADALLAERARLARADGMAQIYALMTAPMERLHAAVADVSDL
jgi:rod shape-determining protein MreC